MSTHPEYIAQTLHRLASMRVDVREIDEGYARGNVPDHKLVMTSMGNARKAVITPTYPAIRFEPKLLDRLDWAATFERPFIEAAIHAKAGKFSGLLAVANVTVRLCRQPEAGKDNMVLETAAQFLLDERTTYGTTESVAQAIVNKHTVGITLPHRTGFVHVPLRSERSKNGKWALADTSIDPEYVAEAIHDATYELPFVRDIS